MPPVNYLAMVQQLMNLGAPRNYLMPIADKFNPLAEQMNPLATTEGARGYSGGRGGPRSELERIETPAIRFEGKIYEGHHHGVAAERAAAKTGRSFDQIANGGEDGFITSTGRFVSRKEAGMIDDAYHGIKSEYY